MPLALAIVAPWVIAIWVESHGSFFQQSLGNDFAAKLAGGQESHGRRRAIILSCPPSPSGRASCSCCPPSGLAITRAKEPAIRFLLAWAGGWWLVCEAVPTKLPHYVLPAYPALAILTALWLLAAKEDALPLWRRVLPYISSLQFVAGAGGAGGGADLLPRLYGGGHGHAAGRSMSWSAG